MENNTVVYRHVRLDENQVFYVGIGNTKRAYNNKNRSKWWKKVVNKTHYRVDILFDNMTREEACEKEMELIQLYGRQDLGTGTLVNMTSGGEGTTSPSPEARRKLSESKLGDKNPMFGIIRSAESKRKLSEEYRIKLSESKLGDKNPMFGKKISEETRVKYRIARLGKRLSKETIEKLRKANSKPIIQLSLDGEFIREWGSAAEAHSTGYFNYSGISKCLRGKNKTHCGYKWGYKNKD